MVVWVWEMWALEKAEVAPAEQVKFRGSLAILI